MYNNDMFVKGLANAFIDSQNIHSKISGNRNWFVKTFQYTNGNLHIDCGRPGNAPKALFSDLLVDIGRHNIRTYWFTYKKDMVETIKEFEAKGASVRYW